MLLAVWPNDLFCSVHVNILPWAASPSIVIAPLPPPSLSRLHSLPPSLFLSPLPPHRPSFSFLPVMSGFTTGAAMSIGLSQIKNAFGFLPPLPKTVPQQGVCVFSVCACTCIVCMCVILLFLFSYPSPSVTLLSLTHPTFLSYSPIPSLSLFTPTHPPTPCISTYFPPFLGMAGFENNYEVMAWYLECWNAKVENGKNEGRFFTNHYAILVSICPCSVFLVPISLLIPPLPSSHPPHQSSLSL